MRILALTINKKFISINMEEIWGKEILDLVLLVH